MYYSGAKAPASCKNTHTQQTQIHTVIADVLEVFSSSVFIGVQIKGLARG